MDDEHAELDLVVRNLTRADLPALVRMDQQITGRTRHKWYEGKIERALEGSDVMISLGAEHDGVLLGAMLGALHYGEFGQPEPIAILDTVLVHREFSRQGVASAMFEQLVKNLRALRIERLRTEVGWDDHELVSFFARKGFAPIPRLVLEVDLGTLEP